MEEEKRLEPDWEMSDDFYNSGKENESLSLEDFITDADDGDLSKESAGGNHNTDDLLRRTAEDVHRVMELALAGKNIAEIAAATGLDQQYIYDIQVCAQGFHEDDEIAVAHLVLG